MRERIEQIDNQLFYLDMKDRWDSDDYEYDRQLKQERKELIKKLEEEGE